MVLMYLCKCETQLGGGVGRLGPAHLLLHHWNARSRLTSRYPELEGHMHKFSAISHFLDCILRPIGSSTSLIHTRIQYHDRDQWNDYYNAELTLSELVTANGTVIRCNGQGRKEDLASRAALYHLLLILLSGEVKLAPRVQDAVDQLRLAPLVSSPPAPVPDGREDFLDRTLSMDQLKKTFATFTDELAEYGLDINRHPLAMIADRLDVDYPYLEFEDDVRTVTATTAHTVFRVSGAEPQKVMDAVFLQLCIFAVQGYEPSRWKRIVAGQVKVDLQHELEFSWLTNLIAADRRRAAERDSRSPHDSRDFTDAYRPDGSLPPLRRQDSMGSNHRPSMDLPHRPGPPTSSRLPPASLDAYRPLPAVDVYRSDMYRPDAHRPDAHMDTYRPTDTGGRYGRDSFNGGGYDTRDRDVPRAYEPAARGRSWSRSPRSRSRHPLERGDLRLTLSRSLGEQEDYMDVDSPARSNGFRDYEPGEYRPPVVGGRHARRSRSRSPPIRFLARSRSRSRRRSLTRSPSRVRTHGRGRRRSNSPPAYRRRRSPTPIPGPPHFPRPSADQIKSALACLDPALRRVLAQHVLMELWVVDPLEAMRMCVFGVKGKQLGRFSAMQVVPPRRGSRGRAGSPDELSHPDLWTAKVEFFTNGVEVVKMVRERDDEAARRRVTALVIVDI